MRLLIIAYVLIAGCVGFLGDARSDRVRRESGPASVLFGLLWPVSLPLLALAENVKPTPSMPPIVYEEDNR